MSIVGTPLFGAPEMMRGEAYDELVDVYSLGVLLLCLGVGSEQLFLFIKQRLHGK
jgi:serine/threonine protein kinase